MCQGRAVHGCQCRVALPEGAGTGDRCVGEGWLKPPGPLVFCWRKQIYKGEGSQARPHDPSTQNPAREDRSAQETEESAWSESEEIMSQKQLPH